MNRVAFAPAGLPQRKQGGFTLIELMVVVAVIGILTAIALPSYRGYIQRGDRAAARAALLEAQQFMERFYIANDSYQADKAGTAVALPARLQSIPQTGAKYNLSVNATAVNAYTLTATPINADNTCGSLTLTNTGIKSQTAGDVSQCWNR